MPPATSAPVAVESFPACSPSAHWPAALTRSAAVTGRSVNSFLPPENVAQSGLRSKVSGLGTSVRLLRPRSDEHAARAEQNTATAIMRNPIWFSVCIATAPAPVTGLDRRAQRRGFCVSTIGLINGCFRFRTREVGAKTCPPYRAKARGAATPRKYLLRPDPRLRDADRDHPGKPEEQKIHRQKRRQTRCRGVPFNHEPDEIGNEVAHDHQADIDDQQGHALLPLPPRDPDIPTRLCKGHNSR